MTSQLSRNSIRKKIRKGEWSLQFIVKARTDMGYSCDYFRREIKRRWPNAGGVYVRRIG